LIINDILDLDKIANGQMEFDIKDVDLAELVLEADQANAMLQQRFGVKVDLIGTQQPVRFHTDPNRFLQVLTNLLTNAYKFSKPNSRILIEVQDEADHVRVSVQDEGPGIPPDDQHKIFDRFVDMANSDRSAKGGTGLGLSICKAIVENLGGTIGFECENGVGTTFYFNLPKVLPIDLGVNVTDDKLSA
jgi:signal transduction histidine kinase